MLATRSRYLPPLLRLRAVPRVFLSALSTSEITRWSSGVSVNRRPLCAVVVVATSTNSCNFFRRFDRHASTSPKSSSPLKTTRGMKETTPLNGPSSLSPTESSHTTEIVDEELSDLAPSEQLSWKERAKSFASEYGRVGVATHLVLSVVSISVIYIGVSSGLDVSGLLHAVGMSADTAGKDSAATSAGSFLIAYTIYKVAAPVRWPLTFAVTPIVMRALRRRGYMLHKTKNNAHRSPSPHAEETVADDHQKRTRK